MRVEINPRSLLNLENICEVLYKLHPSVLNDLVEMERSLGHIIGFINLNNLSLKEREFLSYRVFSLTWPASMQIYWNKRKRLHKKRVQFPQDWFGTPTWPPFHCFGTPIWPP